MFRDDAGRPMARQRVHKRFKDVMEQTGLGRHWQPRETRHTAISIGSEHGASIQDLADIADHKNSRITQTTYQHFISGTVARAPSAIDRGLAAGAKHDP